VVLSIEESVFLLNMSFEKAIDTPI